LTRRRSARAPEWNARHWTSRFLHRLGEVTAHSKAGVVAALTVVGWALVGVVVAFASWWQVTLFSVTSAVTFIMVFVIQHTQARQTTAMQRKLDELVRSVARADDALIAVEEALDEELQALGDRDAAGGQRARNQDSE